jgi:hypothetical protein
MNRLNRYFGFLAAAVLTALPMKAVCQENVRQPEKKIPYVQYVFGESDEWVSYGFFGISRFKTNPPLAGLCLEHVLGATMIGAFSVSADLQAGPVQAGPGISLHWFPSEAIMVSLRFDAVRRDIALSFFFQADDK